MSKITIKTRPLNVQEVTEDVENAIKRGIVEGGGEIVDHTKDIAKTTIRRRGAISSGKLIESFHDVQTKKPSEEFHGELLNTADHARPVEEGAEYTARAPPAIELLPWVIREMQGFQVPEEWSPDPNTVESAQALDSWTDVTAFADPQTIEKVFWLQEHIKEHGTTAVHFMRNARMWAEKRGNEETAKHISAQFRAL